MQCSDPSCLYLHVLSLKQTKNTVLPFIVHNYVYNFFSITDLPYMYLHDQCFFVYNVQSWSYVIFVALFILLSLTAP